MKTSIYTKYGSPDVLEFKEVEKPVPGSKDVLINVRAATVTSVDCTFRRGNEFFARLFTGIKKPKNGVPGGDFSGVVEATGKDVTKFKKGDNVFGATSEGLGGHAEYICQTEDGSIAIKSQDLSFEEAATIPYGFLTALPFIRDTAQIQAGQRILINGAAGSVGAMAVQIAKYYGAHVTAVCSTANSGYVQSLGADEVIDYTVTDFTETGKLWDVIFDAVGKSSFSRCKQSLGKDGVYITTVVGVPILLQMLKTSMIGRKKAVISFTGLRKPDEKVRDLDFFKDLYKAGKIKLTIGKRYPFDQVVEAHRFVEKHHKTGDVVITMAEK